MKIKTSDLTGAALDWAVAKCEEVEMRADPMGFCDGSWWTVSHARFPDTPHKQIGRAYSPSKNWSQGGPIIERDLIAIEPDWNNAGYTSETGYWSWSAYVLGQTNVDDNFESQGPTPLVAAMRCYVASKLGAEVEVPEELI